jgi:hypothetical protein
MVNEPCNASEAMAYLLPSPCNIGKTYITQQTRISLGMGWFKTGFNGLVFLIGVGWFGE